MESRSNTAVTTDECKMPQAKKGFGACSLGKCQGRGVRMCLKADSKEVGRRRGYLDLQWNTEPVLSMKKNKKNKLLYDGT